MGGRPSTPRYEGPSPEEIRAQQEAQAAALRAQQQQFTQYFNQSIGQLNDQYQQQIGVLQAQALERQQANQETIRLLEGQLTSAQTARDEQTAALDLLTARSEEQAQLLEAQQQKASILSEEERTNQLSETQSLLNILTQRRQSTAQTRALRGSPRTSSGGVLTLR